MRKPGSPASSHARTRIRRKFRVRTKPPFGAVKTTSPLAFSAIRGANSSATFFVKLTMRRPLTVFGDWNTNSPVLAIS